MIPRLGRTASQGNFNHPEHVMSDVHNIPSFLLRREDTHSRTGSKRPADERLDIGPPPWRDPRSTTEGVVTLVETVDLAPPHGPTYDGSVRLGSYLDHIDVGTVLIRRPVDADIRPLERPWQAGRVHLDGIRWEENTWPPEDRDAFVDHVARLHETTVPGDERPASAKVVRRA